MPEVARHHRWGDKRRRLAMRRYAQEYLGVERLPRGVPAILRALPADAPAEALRWYLRPYRKPWFGL